VSPLGKNQIGQFLPKAAKNAGLEACGRNISDHWVQKISISCLLDAGIPENFGTRLSGYKNVQMFKLLGNSAVLAHQRQMSHTASFSSKFKHTHTSFSCRPSRSFAL